MSQLSTAKRCAEKMWAGDSASKALGMEIEIREAGAATARMRVREDMVNGFDICHGGMLFALADTAFAFACNAYDRVTFAASASIEFVRPAMLGDTLCATATEEYRGSRSAYYVVNVENDIGELVALFRGRSVSRDQPVLSDKNDTYSIEE
jgi:acyl-CoA thioesterase